MYKCHWLYVMLMHWFPSKIIELTGSSSVSMMGVKRCLIGNDYTSLGFVAMNCWKERLFGAETTAARNHARMRLRDGDV